MTLNRYQGAFGNEWRDRSAKGWIDVLPKSWFQRAGAHFTDRHDVRKGTKRVTAKCDVRVESKRAILVYRRHEHANKHVDVGVMILEFRDNARSVIRAVLWGDSEETAQLRKTKLFDIPVYDEFLAEIMPMRTNRVIDLVRDAGIDVSDWSNFKGGKAKAAVNPKYCYEWSFLGDDVAVLNLWFASMRSDGQKISQSYNWRQRAGQPSHSPKQSSWKRRAERFDEVVRLCWETGLPIRAIICDGEMRDDKDPSARSSRVAKRLLDPIAWAVTEYDTATGLCTLTRGAEPTGHFDADFDPELAAFEGAARRAFSTHRKRESKLRKAKIAESKKKNGGRVICEVPNCGFDFFERYGPLGDGYAHVHHMAPLSAAPRQGQKVVLADLAVVCPNCHAMIHLGGMCRPIETLIPLPKM